MQRFLKFKTLTNNYILQNLPAKHLYTMRISIARLELQYLQYFRS